MRKVLVTGGAGFIGSNLVRKLVRERYSVIVLDLLTYAGNPANLRDLLKNGKVYLLGFGEDWVQSTFRIDKASLKYEGKREPFIQMRKLQDYEWELIEDRSSLRKVLNQFLEGLDFLFFIGSITNSAFLGEVLPLVDGVFHLAAETHVDRSILDPTGFIKTDIIGTFTILEVARRAWRGQERVFLHVSTDEVYGEVLKGSKKEDEPLSPRNPYSAAKASAEQIAKSYFTTYKLPVKIARPSNNYGPYQHPEKLIPLMTIRALRDEPLPVYGDGKQKRDWLYVEDTVRALISVFERGKAGEVYNVAGRCEKENIEVVEKILEILEKPKTLIRFVKDRPAHDRRYSIDDTKIRKELGFENSHDFDGNLKKTVEWYLNNREWWERIIKEDEETKRFMEIWYGER